MDKIELEKIRAVVAEVLNMDVNLVREGDSFADDLGADSLDLLQIVMGIEDVFGIEIPLSEAEKIGTVGDAAEQIKQMVDPW